MRLSTACAALALFAVPTLVSGYSTPPPGKAAPPVVPYLCSDGHEADVIYESGSDYIHAKALVTYEGRTIEMRAAPTLYGVRYRTAAAAEGGAPLAWSLRGEDAWLTESPDVDGYTRQERAIARCVRLRGAMAGRGGEHDDDH